MKTHLRLLKPVLPLLCEDDYGWTCLRPDSSPVRSTPSHTIFPHLQECFQSRHLVTYLQYHKVQICNPLSTFGIIAGKISSTFLSLLVRTLFFPHLAVVQPWLSLIENNQTDFKGFCTSNWEPKLSFQHKRSENWIISERCNIKKDVFNHTFIDLCQSTTGCYRTKPHAQEVYSI